MKNMTQQDVEELIGLPPEKILLKWMNFHLKKAGYEKQVTNFSSDVKVKLKPLQFMSPPNFYGINYKLVVQLVCIK